MLGPDIHISQFLFYLAGIKFLISKNHVILSWGNEDGFIPVQYFDKVILMGQETSMDAKLFFK